MNNDMLYQDITKQVSVLNHVNDVEDLMQVIQPFHAVREGTYKMSFAKRGEIGIWMNLARKYDRMDGLMEKIGRGKVGDVYNVLIDTLVDLALYSLKWLAIIRRFEPLAWEEWCVDNGVVDDDATEDVDLRRGISAEAEDWSRFHKIINNE